MRNERKGRASTQRIAPGTAVRQSVAGVENITESLRDKLKISSFSVFLPFYDFFLQGVAAKKRLRPNPKTMALSHHNKIAFCDFSDYNTLPLMSSSSESNEDLVDFEIPIESTNDLRSPYFNIGMQMFSNTVQMFQFAVLVVIILSNETPKLENVNAELVFAQVFIFFYLIFFCPTGLSVYTRVRMQLFYKDKSEGYQAMMLRKENNSVISTLCNNFFFCVRATLGLFKSSAILFGYNFSEWSSFAEIKMFGHKETLFERFIRFSGYGLEQMNITLLCVGAVFVSNSQESLVDVVFNFGALMIVAELDELLIKTFPYKSYTVKVPSDFSFDGIVFTRSSCEMGEFAYVGFLMTILLVDSRL